MHVTPGHLLRPRKSNSNLLERFPFVSRQLYADEETIVYEDYICICIYQGFPFFFVLPILFRPDYCKEEEEEKRRKKKKKRKITTKTGIRSSSTFTYVKFFFNQTFKADSRLC